MVVVVVVDTLPAIPLLYDLVYTDTWTFASYTTHNTIPTYTPIPPHNTHVYDSCHLHLCSYTLHTISLLPACPPGFTGYTHTFHCLHAYLFIAFVTSTIPHLPYHPFYPPLPPYHLLSFIGHLPGHAHYPTLCAHTPMPSHAHASRVGLSPPVPG